MLASCANCTQGQSEGCSDGVALAEGDLLCDRYRITNAFRDEIVAKALADVRAEIDLAILKHQLDRSTHFAG